MSSPSKAPPVYKPKTPRIAAPPVYRPNQLDNASAQLKPANNFRTETRPAPPIYRPQSGVASGAVQPRKPVTTSVFPPPKSNGFGPTFAPVGGRPAVANHFVGHPPAIQRTSYLSGMWNSVVNYFYPPPPQPQAAPQHVPTPEEKQQELLEKNREHFMETGSPSYSEIREIYPGALDPAKWSRLTHVHGQKKNLKKRAQNQSPEAVHGLVRELFSNFVSYGFGYSIMTSGAQNLLDTVSGKDSPNGNCLAYARAFADIVNSFGIEAEADYVRGEDAGRFIVKLDRFIDPRVLGHIYEKGALKAGYFMFTSHAATWVPATGTFYDPMAVAWYTSLDPYIECELDSENETVFTPRTRPKTLCTGYEWKLIRRAVTLPGQFNKLDLVPLKKKKTK